MNTTLLAFLMYRSAGSPDDRRAGAGDLSSGMAMLVGVYENGSAVAVLAAIPVFCREMSLGAG